MLVSLGCGRLGCDVSTVDRTCQQRSGSHLEQDRSCVQLDRCNSQRIGHTQLSRLLALQLPSQPRHRCPWAPR